MLVTLLLKEHCRNEGTEENVTRMIKGMENSYEERLKRQIISSKIVTSGSVEDKINIYKIRNWRKNETLILSSAWHKGKDVQLY